MVVKLKNMKLATVDWINATDSYLPVREVCRLLSIHGNTLRRWSDDGIIKAYRIGPAGHRRYKAADVAALLYESAK